MHTSPEPHIGTVCAPGKLVLIGDYAVTDGGSAIVIAINRGVMCTVTQLAEELRIETPTGDTRFVSPALAGRTGLYQFRDWNPVSIPDKPGFGGSASACVAACIAAGRPAADAIALHHAVQGSGSGIDVAAAIHGGMIHFREGSSRAIRPVLPVVVYSGSSARTGPRVRTYKQWSPRDDFIEASNELVTAFEADPILATRAAARLLTAMARSSGLSYLTPGLQRVMDLAEVHHGAAKPSGAGGGDCAVAFFADAEAAAAFIEACRGEGFPPIPIEAARGAGWTEGGPHGSLR